MEVAKKQDNQLSKIFKQPLTVALLSGNRQEVNKALEPFKDGAGYNYPQILSLPVRLPKMAEIDYKETLAVLVVAISKALAAMNLNRPMNAEQIVELAETIIDSSKEDYLALEDVVLFMQGLVRGKYGALYESMDIPKFMEKFEVYRIERHQAYYNIQDEKHSQLKAQGDSNRWSTSENDREKDLNREALADYLKATYKNK